MLDKIGRRLGLKDDTGWDDPSTVGFIVIWGAIGYGAYIALVAIIERLIG
jgi:hypothetical protein